MYAHMYRPLYSIFNRTLKKECYARYIQRRQMCVYARTLIVSRDSLFLNTSRLPAVTMSDGRAFHIRVTSGKMLCLQATVRAYGTGTWLH